VRARLFGFREVPARLGELTVRTYQPGDEHEILETFNRVFARVDVTFRPRTLDFWRWRFLENPSGSRIVLALTPEGRVAGQLAVIVQRVRLAGRPSCFGQGVDQMSDPELKQGLGKSLVGVLGNTVVLLHAGSGPDQDSLGWGAPVPAAWRAGKSFARYEIIRTQLKLCGRPEELVHAAAPGIEVVEARDFPEEVSELFERAAAPHGAIAVRDKARLDWRWVRHPEKRCRIGLARRGRRLLGYAVFARGAFDGASDEGLVCDWLVDPREPGAAPALRAWLAHRAREQGSERLVAIFPDTVREWLDFQRAGFRVVPSRYFLIGRQYLRAVPVRWVREHWYYTLGDTDLV
jgi:hypothetical protein